MEVTLQIAHARGDHRDRDVILKEAAQRSASISLVHRRAERDPDECAEVVTASEIWLSYYATAPFFYEGEVMMQSGGRVFISPVFRDL
jgi:hypothetical protein